MKDTCSIEIQQNIAGQVWWLHCSFGEQSSLGWCQVHWIFYYLSWRRGQYALPKRL